MNPIDNPDTTNTDPLYWEQVLLSHGLAMSKGTLSHKKVSLVGGLNNLVSIEQEDYVNSTGKVSPSGHGPDK